MVVIIRLVHEHIRVQTTLTTRQSNTTINLRYILVTKPYIKNQLQRDLHLVLLSTDPHRRL